MVKFLTTRGTISEVERIINDARMKLVLISPYLNIPKTLLECIEAASRKIPIKLVYGKKELSDDIAGKLGRINNLSIYFYKDVHAKCYFNEESMVITSLNLLDFSESHNREMGVAINRQSDSEVYREAAAEAERIINFAERVNLKKPSPSESPANKKKTKASSFAPNTGYCIRCGTEIRYDPNKPYCRSCYDSWVEWENPGYLEKVCHWCGKPSSTTIEYPLCRGCFRKLQG